MQNNNFFNIKEYDVLCKLDEKIELDYSFCINNISCFANRYVSNNIEKYSLSMNNVNSIILHTTSLESVEKAVEIYTQYGVSAHFIIDQNGKIYLLVPPDLCAYHAGVSYFGNLTTVRLENYGNITTKGFNAMSIGIELLTPDYHNISQKQTDSLGILIAKLKEEIPSISNILTHQTIAPLRKSDPSFFARCIIVQKLQSVFVYNNIKLLPIKYNNNDHDFLVNFFQKLPNITREEIEVLREYLRNIGYMMNVQGDLAKQISLSLADYLLNHEMKVVFASDATENLLQKAGFRNHSDIGNEILYNLSKQNMLYNVSNSHYFGGKMLDVYKLLSIIQAPKIYEMLCQMDDNNKNVTNLLDIYDLHSVNSKFGNFVGRYIYNNIISIFG